MAKKKLFDDLKQAILSVILNAYPDFQDGQYTNEMIIDKDLLYILQSEYNIHFVEPHEKQLDTIQK